MKPYTLFYIIYMATTITLRYIMEQGLFSGVRVTRSLVFCVMVCRSLFVPLSFFFWSLCSLFFELRFWLPIWYLVTIVFSVLRITASDYPSGILWALCSLSFELRLLITHLLSCDHCVLCPSSYGFWLPICYLVAIVFSVLRVTASDYPFAILLPLCSLSFELRLLITHLLSCDHCVLCPSRYGFWLPICYLVAIVFSVLRVTASDYPSGILWSLCSLSFKIRLLITHLVSCDHCVLCPSSYGFWLPICYLVTIVFSVLRVTASHYPSGILWSLCSLSFELRVLITHLLSCGHCVLFPSSYGFWLPICYLVAIVFSVLRFTASDYPFAIFKIFFFKYTLLFSMLRLLFFLIFIAPILPSVVQSLHHLFIYIFGYFRPYHSWISVHWKLSKNQSINHISSMFT